MADLERLNTSTPLLIPAVFLTAGILICREYFKALDFTFLCIGIGSLILAVLLYLFLVNKRLSIYLKYRLRNLHYLWLALSFFAIGIILQVINSPRIDSYPLSIYEASISGSVRDIRYSNSGDVLLIDAISIIDGNGIELNPENLILKINNVSSHANYGDFITFKSNLKRIEDSPNSFFKDYAHRLKKQGILYEGEIIDNQFNAIGNHQNFHTRSNRVRDNLEIAIEHAPLSKRTHNFLITTLLGDKQYVDNNTRTLFAESGTSHILALSGLHIGIIAGFILALFFPLNFAGRYKIRLIITISLLWGYAFICGFTPSAVRACAMCSFAFISIILERKYTLLNSICFAYILILLFAPNSIYDPGFILSFLCVFVIVTIMPHLKLFDHRKHKYLYNASTLIFVTFVVTACSWMITTFFFHTIPLSFLFINTICLPLLPLYLFIAIIYIISFDLGLNIPIFKWVLDQGYQSLNSLQHFFSSGTVIYTTIPVESVILWIAALLLFVIYLNLYRNRYVLLSTIISASFSILCLAVYPPDFNENDFIICNNYREVKLNVIKDGKENPIYLKRNTCDSINIGSLKVVSVDVDSTQINIPRNIDLLILCGGFKGSLPEILENHEVSKVIIHPSIRRKRESLLLKDLQQLNIEAHSLRLHKPLKVLSDPVH